MDVAPLSPLRCVAHRSAQPRADEDQIAVAGADPALLSSHSRLTSRAIRAVDALLAEHVTGDRPERLAPAARRGPVTGLALADGSRRADCAGGCGTTASSQSCARETGTGRGVGPGWMDGREGDRVLRVPRLGADSGLRCSPFRLRSAGRRGRLGDRGARWRRRRGRRLLAGGGAGRRPPAARAGHALCAGSVARIGDRCVLVRRRLLLEARRPVVARGSDGAVPDWRLPARPPAVSNGRSVDSPPGSKPGGYRIVWRRPARAPSRPPARGRAPWRARRLGRGREGQNTGGEQRLGPATDEGLGRDVPASRSRRQSGHSGWKAGARGVRPAQVRGQGSHRPSLRVVDVGVNAEPQFSGSATQRYALLRLPCRV